MASIAKKPKMVEVPKKIKDYTVCERIASGAFGSVYFIERGGQTFAVKFEPRENASIDKETEVPFFIHVIN